MSVSTGLGGPTMPDLTAVAASGDRLDTLRALRDTLASAIDATESARDLAALSRQLTDVLEQVAECEKAAPKPKGTPLDELATRRAARRPVPSGRKRAASTVD
jgi:hypothetical protein